MKVINSKYSSLAIGGREFSSRLFIDTGEFSSNSLLKDVIEASKTEMVTVALRKVDPDNPENEFRNTVQQNKNIQLLPDTSSTARASSPLTGFLR